MSHYLSQHPLLPVYTPRTSKIDSLPIHAMSHGSGRSTAETLAHLFPRACAVDRAGRATEIRVLIVDLLSPRRGACVTSPNCPCSLQGVALHELKALMSEVRKSCRVLIPDHGDAAVHIQFSGRTSGISVGLQFACSTVPAHPWGR